MPALPAITAKILVLVEYVLDVFVDVQLGASSSNCAGILVFNGTTTPCGDELVTYLSVLVFQLSALGSYFLAALGVQVY